MVGPNTLTIFLKEKLVQAIKNTQPFGDNSISEHQEYIDEILQELEQSDQ